MRMVRFLSHTTLWGWAGRLALGLLLWIATPGIAAAQHPAPPLYRFEYSQLHMGVQVRLVLYAPTESAAFEAARAAFSRVAELDQVMSDYRSTSELMRLCRRSGQGPVPVSADLFAVLEQAQRLARLSDGAFDVTAGPCIRLWRRARRSGTLPSPDSLVEARARTGWQQLRLDPATRTVHLTTPGMQLDLGGIAKGFAADEALAVLQAHGIASALVEMGGDLRLGKAPPGRDGWRVRLPNAPADRQEAMLANVAVSSSGDTEQYIEVDGLRYSHIVDPRTCSGLTDRIAVTVIAPTAFLSDGLSTTLSILGPERGQTLLHEHFPEVRAFVRHGEDARGPRQPDP